MYLQIFIFISTPELIKLFETFWTWWDIELDDVEFHLTIENLINNY